METNAGMIRVLAVDGSPKGGGRTRAALDAVLAGAADAGATTSVAELHEAGSIEATVASLGEFDAFVFGAPAYRTAAAAPLKAFLDVLPRGFWGEKEQPITAKAVGLLMTGATYHHYLALDGVRNILAGFFAAHVLSPGLYLAADSFDEATLTEKADAAARAQGRALVALARAIDASEDLRAIRPQA